jgi:hypothetical protein
LDWYARDAGYIIKDRVLENRVVIRLARRKGKNKSRQTSITSLSSSPDYVIRRFNAIFGRAEKPEGAEPSLELPLNAIFRSNWN